MRDFIDKLLYGNLGSIVKGFDATILLQVVLKLQLVCAGATFLLTY